LVVAGLMDDNAWDSREMPGTLRPWKPLKAWMVSSFRPLCLQSVAILGGCVWPWESDTTDMAAAQNHTTLDPYTKICTNDKLY
jgi:hypothetical protein